MKSNTVLYNISRLFIAFLLLISIDIQSATLFENFDSPSVASTSNNGATITYLSSGSWFTNGITKPTNPNENDRINGVYSMRMRGLDGKNVMYMNFDKAGAGILSFNYGSYGNYSNGEFTIQKSTNGGVLWETIGSPVVVPKWSGTFLTYSLPVNYNGNIRFKIVVTCRTVNNPNEQFNIDDLMITDFGTEQTAIPVSSVATGVYETPQSVSLSNSTPGATIYYTTDGSKPTIASNVYSTALNISATTKIRAIAVAAGKEDSREEVVLISFPISISTLAELTAKLATT
ncbi:MAG: chitobiase/beta-hexosaminidase C-terminal domain-containing protein, partial [Paludibacter sp.]